MDCWSQVRALEGKPLRTLDHHRPPEVVAVAENQVAEGEHGKDTGCAMQGD